ncbi:helix-turn-helix domain-containing protein [Bacillus sp. IITD106]|nr:helix-turn-helix domain-containing protein [Bacillus sp. IITD106]
MITREIGEMIVKEASKVLKLNINIMNDKGIIIASGDPSRINYIHEGALKVVQTNLPVEITENNKKMLRGTLTGINLPIYFQDNIIGVIGITGDPEEIGNRGILVQMMTELMVKQAYMTSQSEWRQRTKDMIIEELLMENQNNERIDRRLSLLDLKMEAPFIICLIEIGDSSFSRSLLIKRIEEIIGEQNVIAGFININKLIIISTALTYDKVTFKLNEIVKEFKIQKIQMRLAYSTIVQNIQGIPNGYKECEIALEMSDSEHKIIPYVDVEAKALVNQIDSRFSKPFRDRILQKNLKSYVETLQVFFDCSLNIKDAAEKLYIHRNTLIYRLNKIKQESGYDPQNFHDAFAIQLAIWMNNKYEKEHLSVDKKSLT